jgi:hypothetical protein
MSKRVTKNGIVKELNLTPNELNTAESFGVIAPIEKIGQCHVYDLLDVCKKIKQAAIPGSRIYKHAARYLESEVSQ